VEVLRGEVRKGAIVIDNNLLIGNGINMAFDKVAYSAEAIKKRLLDVLENTKILYQALFNIDNADDMLNNVRKHSSGMNIEQIADELYRFIWDYCMAQGVRQSVNLRKRIIAAIKISSLTAIFIDYNHLILPAIPAEKAALLKSFNHVYSLNYYEFWNPHSDYCTYMHGAIPQDVMNDLLTAGVPSIFYDEPRYVSSSSDRSCHEAAAFHCAIDELKMNFKLYPLHDLAILFSPSMQDKVKLIGNYPSNDNSPCWDNYPSSTPKPYVDFEHIDKLCLFGVSPYGDDRLIDALKSIVDLQIFIHDKSGSSGKAEIDDWKKLLSRKPVFRDSAEFWAGL
jgi:hypothetical protein